MGTIVYHEGSLVGDSRFYDKVGGMYIPYEKPRVVLDRSKQFAYGICGNNIPFSDPEFSDTVTRFITSYLEDVNFNEEFPYKEIHILVMTGNKTFTIYNDGKLAEGDFTKQFIVHEPHSIIAYGTGASNAVMAIIAGSNAVDALKDVTLNDFYTGGDLYGVRRSTLNGENKVNQLEDNGGGWFKSRLSRISK